MALHFSPTPPDPQPAPELAELSRVACKLLNRSVTAETHAVLRRYGMPPGEDLTLGNVLEMVMSPVLPLLSNATTHERASWGEWTARLMVLYRQHVQSEEFLMDRRGVKMIQFFELPETIPAPQGPFGQSDYDVLSWSDLIAAALGERIGGEHGSVVGRAFEFELKRCSQEFSRIAELALSASQRLRK